MVPFALGVLGALEREVPPRRGPATGSYMGPNGETTWQKRSGLADRSRWEQPSME